MTTTDSIFPVDNSLGITKGDTEGFWNERRVRIAKIIGTVAVISILTAALFFIPGAPLALYGTILAGATLFKLGASMFAAKLILEAAVIFVPTGVAALVYLIGEKILRDREDAAAITAYAKSKFENITMEITIVVDKSYFDNDLKESLTKKNKSNEALRNALRHYTDQEKNTIHALVALTMDKFKAEEFEDKICFDLKLVDADKDTYDIKKDDSGITLTTKKSFLIKQRDPGLFGICQTYGTIELECVARSNKVVTQEAAKKSTENLLDTGTEAGPVEKYTLPKKLSVTMPKASGTQSQTNKVSSTSEPTASPGQIFPPIKRRFNDESEAEKVLLQDLNRTAEVNLNGQVFNKDNKTEALKAFQDAISDLQERIFALDLCSHRLPVHVFTSWANECMIKDNLCKHPKKISKGFTAEIHFSKDGAPIIKGSIVVGFIDAAKATDPHNPHIFGRRKLSYEANARTGEVSASCEEINS